MTDAIGVVACSSLRPEVEAIAPEAAVAYVPHELHESPLDPGCDGAVTGAVQAAVDRLSTPSRPAIALAYARAGDGLAAVEARSTPLVAWRAADCAEALCGRPVGATGEAKAPGTYYLTPGAVEAGLDPYKLYLAYAGGTDGLVARLEAGVGDDGRVSWHRGARVAALIADGPRPELPMLRDQFRAQFGGYDRVVLLDTGAVAPVHRRYARRLGRFLDGLRGGREPVAVAVHPADVGPLRALLDGTDPGGAGLDVVPPGERLGPVAPGPAGGPRPERTHAVPTHD